MKVNAQGVKSADDVKASRRPLDGKYHVAIKAVDESLEKVFGENKNHAVIVSYEVLKGTTPGQEGMEFTEFMFLKDNGPSETMLKFALVTGLLKPGEVAEVNFSDAKDRQIIVELKSFKKKDKSDGQGIAEFGTSMWAVGHPDTKDVPLDGNALNLWRSSQQPQGQQQRSTQAAQAQPAQQQQAAAQPAGAAAATAGGDDWGDV